MPRFRVLIVGCGNMANAWVQYAHSREDVQIVGLVDIDRTQAEALAARHGLHVPLWSELDSAIKATGANLVMDVTVPAAHHHVAQTAMRLGCDVLQEKPMAASLDKAKETLAVATAEGRRYVVMQNRRYLRQIRAFRDLIAAGTIGQPGFVNADFFLGPHFGGFRDEMASPLLLDMAIHTFDQARFITGSHATSVYCHEFNPPGSWYKGNAAAVCIFEFADGSVFCYRGSWCAEGAPTPWEATWRITGTKGTAIWDGANMPFAEVVQPSDKFQRDAVRVDGEARWQGSEGHNGCFDEMFASLIEGRAAETEASDNIHSVAMVFAALESARRGCRVPIVV